MSHPDEKKSGPPTPAEPMPGRRGRRGGITPDEKIPGQKPEEKKNRP